MLHKYFLFSLLLVTGTCVAETEMQIRLNTLRIGDSKEKVIAILGPATGQAAYQWPGLSCDRLFYKKNLAQVPPQTEELTLTFCADRLITHTYAVHPLFNL